MRELLLAVILLVSLPWLAAGADEQAERGAALATARMIDARIDRALNRAGLIPAPPAAPEELLRRLSLDLNGVVPHYKTVQSYLKSRRPDRLSRTIETLLAAPRFEEHFADVLLRAWVGRRRDPQALGFRDWLIDQLQKRVPFDRTVQAVVSARGRVQDNAAAYFARRWGREPAEVAAQSARVFMGLQIQCAQCHDHPFADWKQEQFHEFAAFFTNGFYGYKLKRSENYTAFSPRFLFPLEISEEEQARDFQGRDTRKMVARLITHKENPYFARMTVNRIWKELFGRGLVEPTEDLEGEEGRHPLLLSFLAEDFIARGHDLPHLLRAIVHSRAYQRSSRRPEEQADPALEKQRLAGSADREAREAAALKAEQELWLFARGSLRPLTMEQIVASLLRATGREPKKRYTSKKAGELARIRFEQLRRNLLAQFGQLYDGAEPTDPDPFDGTIPQTLIMLNGSFINAALKPDPGTMMAHIIGKGGSSGRHIDRLFLAVLSRAPSKEEHKRFTDYLKRRGRSIEGCEDVMWALINSSEFLLNH